MYIATKPSHAPAIVNVENGELVHQRILLIYGRAGPQDVDFESKITVEHHANNFPSTTWQVFNSHFKCLVNLDPGLNNIKFILDTEPYSPGSKPLTTAFQVNYVPLLQNPPLNLVILVAKDSKEVIDVPKEKENSDEGKLAGVIEKFRCAGYLWQAFTAEQMKRNGFKGRVFRLDEEWTKDTLTNQNSKLRQTAKVHVIRSSFTLEQILDPDIAQQNPKRVDGKKDLYAMFMEALQDHGAPFDQTYYVAGLILDTHYDPVLKFVRGHAALGGGQDNKHLGIFGSHLAHAWPRYLEEVISCFQAINVLDESRLCNDAGECGNWWKCCNVGIGAFLHEVGHGLGCPHTPSGIMLRGFNNLNRTFAVKEPNNPSPIKPSDEDGAHWHRCDIVRFRYHPCFRLPSDPSTPSSIQNAGIDFWLTDDFLLVKCAANISLIEFYIRDSIVEYLDYAEKNKSEITLEIPEIIKKHDGDKNDIRVKALAQNQAEAEVENLQKFWKESKITVPEYGVVYKSIPFGRFDDNSAEFKVLFNKLNEKNKLVGLKRIIVKYNLYVESITFIWSDDTNLKVGAGEQGTEKVFALNEGECIAEVKIKSGWYLDGFEIITSSGNSSGWFGGSGGGDHVLKVPNDKYEMVGLYGTSGGAFINTFGFIYKKK